MKKEFVTYEQALALKELGFEEPCLASYYHAGKKLDVDEYISHGEYTVLAPLKQQVFRWFREKYNADVVIQPQVVGYYAKILINNKSVFDIIQTYEEAESACLREMVKIVKTYGGNK